MGGEILEYGEIHNWVGRYYCWVDIRVWVVT